MDKDLVNSQEAHTITELSLNYTDPSDTWTLNGYVKNIENTAKKFAFGMNSIQIGPPRTFGAVLQVKF